MIDVNAQYQTPADHLADIQLLIDDALIRALNRISAEQPVESGAALTELIAAAVAAFTGPAPQPGDPLPDYNAILTDQIGPKVADALSRNVPMPIRQLQLAFELSNLEILLLGACISPDATNAYNTAFTAINLGGRRSYATVHALLQLFGASQSLAEPVRRALEPDAKLRRWKFLELQESPGPALFWKLQPDRRLTLLALGEVQPDPALSSCVFFPTSETPIEELSIAESARARLAAAVPVLADDGRSKLFYFYGQQGAGKLNAAVALANAAGRSVVWLDARRMLNSELDARSVILRALRDAAVFNALFVVTDIQLLRDASGASPLLNWLFELHGAAIAPLALTGEQKPDTALPAYSLATEIEFPTPDVNQRIEIWQDALTQVETAADLSLSELAQTFLFTAGQIERAVQRAASIAPIGASERPAVSRQDLLLACRKESNRRLAEVAMKIEAAFTWDDLILPEDTRAQLQEIAARAALRHQVYSQWGFERVLGASPGQNALFYGPSGSGKTMAASIIARQLNVDVYKADLATLAGGSSGETEKNLARLFEEAEACNAILFFDDADALASARSDSTDAQERGAKIEIGFLLQKMDEYSGLTILASSQLDRMDDALKRRLQFVIEFPFPDRTERERIWRLAFPAQAPLAEEPDYALLAARLRLTGASIKNAALTAAFFAAAENSAISMEHILRAARREYQKEGRSFVEADLEAQPA